MSLRILIGYEKPGQRGQSTALYVGPEGSELRRIQAENTTHASFLILNNPAGIRKTNDRFGAAPAAQPAKKKTGRKPAPEPGPALPEDSGPGLPDEAGPAADEAAPTPESPDLL